MQRSLLITCEHAKPDIPQKFLKPLNVLHKITLSHQAFDEGALEIAQSLAKRYRTAVIASDLSRLLVDFNRTPDFPKVFSRFSKTLDENLKNELINRHQRHWERVRSAIKSGIKQKGIVLHLGVHSFIPIFNGKKRSTDIGILFDPSNNQEREAAEQIKKSLSDQLSIKVALNRPYRGNTNGLTTAMRLEFPKEKYLGLELEVNQRLLKDQKLIQRVTRWMAIPVDSFSKTPL
jgi:predicted N-formylglutamate amidohydrolase